MATGGGNTYLYDCQVAACQKFFHEQLPVVPKYQSLTKECKIPENMKHYAKPIYLYDITGFDAHQVIAVLVGIINDRDKFKTNKTFYLKLDNTDESKNDQIEELFRLKARPTKDQPGNGIVFIRPRRKRRFQRHAKDYEEINGALKAHYQEDTKSFAKDIKKLFLDNADVESDFPQATFEAYMILLFEIARRLVALEKPSESKTQHDVHPIGSAIAGIVKLLECGKEEICTFDNVFLPGGKFHCFSSRLQIRKNAIGNICDTASEQAAMLTKERATKYFLEELQETFSRSKKINQSLEWLISFLTKRNKRKSSTLKSSVDTETFTAFDYEE